MNQTRKILLVALIGTAVICVAANRLPLIEKAARAASAAIGGGSQSLGKAEGSHSQNANSTKPAACIVNPIVTANTDSGAGSLRQAIIDACAGSTITFNMAPGNVTSPISLTTDQLVINQNLTIQGPGANTLNVMRSGAAPSFRIFNTNSGTTVSISGLTINNGNLSGDGGGVLNQGTLTLAACAVTGNITSTRGGGVTNATGGTLTINGSTISGNTASVGGGGITNAGTLTLINSTISGNTSDGLSNNTGATANLSNDTFSNNSIRGITSNPGSTTNVRNTIVANTPGAAGDVQGTFVSQSNNLIGKSNGSAGFTNGVNNDKVGTVASPLNPLLASLGNYGGPTQTMALLPGSPAIDAGDNCVTQAAHCGIANLPQLTTDQRGTGFNRLVDGDGDGTATVDIGAFEVQSILVTNTNDSGAGSLRQAIIDANVNPGTDAINFQAGVTGTVTLLTALPDLSTSMFLNGPGANLLTISGNGTFRLIKASSPGSNVMISGLSFTGGGAQAGANASVIEFNNGGTLTLANSEFFANSGALGVLYASTSGGVTVSGSTFRGNTPFAILYCDRTPLTVVNSTFSGNSAFAVENGAVGSTVTNSTITNNSGGVRSNSLACGGCAASVTVTNTLLSSNLSRNLILGGTGTLISGGHNLIDDATAANFTAPDPTNIIVPPGTARLSQLVSSGPTQTRMLLPGSPAIDAGDNCVTQAAHCGIADLPQLTTDQRGAGFNRLADGNGDGTATVDIGAFEVQSILVTNTNDSGAGSLRQAITDANVNPGIDAINFQAGVTGTITLLTALPELSTSMAFNGPGANGLTVMRSAAPGTPLFRFFTIFDPSVAIGVSGLTLSNADSPENGGAIINYGSLIINAVTFSGNHTTAGGSAIINTDTGTVTLSNSTLLNNHADILAAIYNQGAAFNIINSTLTGNANLGDAPGTAIFSESDSVTNVTNCTIFQNTGQDVALFQNNGGAGKLNVKNSIVSGNTGGDVSTNITNNGNNLIGGNPMLSTLGNYGGPTQTFALLPGSPAIDAGSNCVLTNACVPAIGVSLTTDQRGTGFNRTVNTTVDIGAFESRGFTISVTSGSGQSAPITSAFASPLVATVGSAFSEPVTGGIVTFTAPATGASSTFPGGLRTFNATISAGGQASAAPTANALAGGPYAVSAASNGISSSASFSLTNAKATTTTALTSSANPSGLAQSVTFTATVTSPAGTPSGTVQFKDNGTNLGAAVTLSGSGKATLSTSSLTAGTHTITADYSGDANFNSSTGTLSGGQVVNNRPVISFSAATYSVSESTGFLNITVNRTGDTVPAVTVDYATDDTAAPASCGTVSGIASSRCDFTTAIGTLKFAAGETQKTFTVLVNGDSYLEGPESFAINLSNPTGGGALATPALTIVTITDGPTGPPANLIDDTRFFVRQHYHDFLNREPDQPGWDFWSNNINNCTPQPSCTEAARVSTSASFFLSIEFQQTGYLIERMYKASYGDANGTSTIGGLHQIAVPIVRFLEFVPDTQLIEQGVVVGQPGWEAVLENNKQAFAAQFVQRSRFATALPTTLTPALFVDQLFQNAGVTPTANDRQAAIAEFNSATNTSDVAARGRALRDVAENSLLVQQEFNHAFVLMQYYGYLRRNPNDTPDSDYSGYDFWLTKLNQFNGNFINAEMVKAFIASLEYRQRFGQ